MSRASPILTSFNAGEFSATLDGRVDLAKYANGCKRLENFLPLIQGPATRRGGTAFHKELKTSANRAWLVRFEFSATQAYVLEFGDVYLRVHKSDHTYIGEFVSPYALADLTNADGTFALKCVQSGDVIYIANQKRTYAPRKLTRVSEASWVFSTYQPNQGPFIEQNSSTTTMQASAQTGAITVTASAATFAASDVGRLIRIESQNLSVQPWEVNVAYALNALTRYGGKTYKALVANTSGSVPPTHTHGTAYDGKSSSGVQWQYMDSGYGIARITAFTDSTHVTASVIVDEDNGLAQMPADVVSTTSTRWSLGAWSGTTEYPASVTFWRNRLWWAGRQRIWASVPNDFENMAGDFFGQVQIDNAIWEQLQAEDVNDVAWIVGADQLVVGTGGGEFIGRKITDTDPIGPGNFELVRQSKRRVRAVQPIAVGTSLLYVQRAGRKLLSLNYSLEIDSFNATDLAVLAERITRGGIVDMAFQSEPYSILWCVLASGKLMAFTYDRDQDVQGWHRHPLGGSFTGAGNFGGVVESVAVTPTSDGAREQLWLVVKRTINGVTKRYIEYMRAPWEGPDDDGTEGDDQEDAFYVDCGITYDGVSTTSITGLSHLEGQSVQVLADGAVQPSKTVTGGAITLDRAASVVQVGLQFISKLVPMRLEAGSQTGTSQGKIKRIDSVIARLFESAGGKAGLYSADGSTRMDDFSERSPSTPMDEPEPFYSRDVRIDFPGDYDRESLFEIRQEQPLPMTVVAIMPQVRSYDP